MTPSPVDLPTIQNVVDTSDIFWKSEAHGVFTYSQQFLPPFVVLMECKNTGKNLGKYNPTAVGKMVGEFTDGERTIHINGCNQVKIFCETLGRQYSSHFVGVVK